jgi:hypothetical protein
MSSSPGEYLPTQVSSTIDCNYASSNVAENCGVLPPTGTFFWRPLLLTHRLPSQARVLNCIYT